MSGNVKLFGCAEPTESVSPENLLHGAVGGQVNTLAQSGWMLVGPVQTWGESVLATDSNGRVLRDRSGCRLRTSTGSFHLRIHRWLGRHSSTSMELESRHEKAGPTVVWAGSKAHCQASLRRPDRPASHLFFSITLVIVSTYSSSKANGSTLDRA